MKHPFQCPILIKKAGFWAGIMLFLMPFVFGYCNETQNVTGNITQITRQCTSSTDVGGAPLFAIIIAPLVLSFLILYGGMHLDSDTHAVLKIFLFMFGIIPYWVSMHFGTIVLNRYYDLLDLENAMGDTVFWSGLILFTIVSYFMIYLLVRLFARIGENKEQKLEY